MPSRDDRTSREYTQSGVASYRADLSMVSRGSPLPCCGEPGAGLPQPGDPKLSERGFGLALPPAPLLDEFAHHEHHWTRRRPSLRLVHGSGQPGPLPRLGLRQPGA